MKYIAGNWKANQTWVDVEAFGRELISALNTSPLPQEVELIVCPTAVFYSEMQHLVPRWPVKLGLQDISLQDGGAHTGEVTVKNLAGIEPAYVIVGHSERRRDQGETNAQVAAKVGRVLSLGACPIVCFDLEELADLTVKLQPYSGQNIVLAYEPVSAISTSGAAGNLEPVLLQERLVQIRATLPGEWPVLYGGSVKADNAAAYGALCDGLLVGGASLKAESLVAIARAFSG